MSTIHYSDDHLQTRFYVYVWELPVRFFHWINALCILVLAVTGYLMGNPLSIASSAEASQRFWFGDVRFIHFVTAYVWVAIAFMRLYWGFAGNKHARFKNFLPLTRAQWQEIFDVFRVDILELWRGATFNIGHNALAGLTYAIAFLGFLFSMMTGFGLYAEMSDGWFSGLFAWVVPLFGSDHLVRLWHHMMLWFFAVFFMIHVYLAAYHDYVEATGTISSMVGGWKFGRKADMDLIKKTQEETGKKMSPAEHHHVISAGKEGKK